MSALSAIIFDYGKVLSLSPTQPQWDRLASKFGDLPTFMKHYWGFRDDYDRGVDDAAKYWNKIAESMGKKLANGDVEQLVEWDNEQWTNINPEMLAFAREAKQKGLKIAILSNMQPEILRYMRAKFAWLSEFDVEMYSCEEGTVKPDAKIYLDCCKRLGVEPQRALFLDDKQKNIDGALRAGLQAHLFEGQRSEVEKYLA